MNDLKKKLKKQGGFTLVEMLIVIAIIAILIAISIPMVSSSLEKAREAVDRANARSAVSLAAIEVLTADPATPVASGTSWHYVVSNNSGSLSDSGGIKGKSKSLTETELVVTYTATNDGKGSFTTTYDGKIGTADP